MELLEPPALWAAPELLEPLVEMPGPTAPLELPKVEESETAPLLEEPLAGLLPAAVTWMEKGGSALVLMPSLALMRMLGYVPVSGAFGVPETFGLTPAALALAAAAPPLSLEIASLEPPQGARAAVRVRTAKPWPSSRQFSSVRMSHRLAIR